MAHKVEKRPGQEKAQAPDLRDWLAAVGKTGKLQEVRGASWDLEVGVLTDLNAKSRKWTLLFDEIRDYPHGHRLLTGCLLDSGRVALALGLSAELTDAQLVRELRNRLSEVGAGLDRYPPQVVSKAPFLQNSWEDSKVNVEKFPAMRWHEGDGGRYLGTADAVVTRDPDSNWVNVGTYRMMVQDKRHLGIYMNVTHHARAHAEKYWARGEDCPVAISLGHHPVVGLFGGMEVPTGVSEYNYTGSLMRQSQRVVPGPVTGLPVPADSELVMEGVITREARAEGPYGEFIGYYAGGGGPSPLVRVDAVHFRDDPIVMGTNAGRPPYDYSYFRCPLRSALLWNALEEAGIEGIQGVWCHESGYSRALTIVSLNPGYQGHASQVGFIAAQLPEGIFGGKYVVVVDSDIDPTNTEDVLWAICSRTDPVQDIEFIRDSWGMSLDPMANKGTGAKKAELRMSRAIVNACRPFDRVFRGEFPKTVEPNPEIREMIQAKWRHLLV